MRDQNKQVDQNFISRTIDLKIFKEDVDSKKLECFVDDVSIIERSEWEVGRSIEIGFDRNDRKTAGCFTKKGFVVC